MFALEEIFRARAYEPPPQVASALRGLGRGPRVLDLGANAGLFALYAIGELGASRVISYEPDPESFAVLERCRTENDVAADWDLVRAFATNTGGEVEFIQAHLLGRSAASEEDLERSRQRVRDLMPFLPEGHFGSGDRIKVEARDVFPELAHTDLAKIDIEGAEWNILQDTRLSKSGPVALALEVHASEAPRADFAAAARSLLAGAGYEVGEDTLVTEDAAVLWAWREPTESSPPAAAPTA
jgi:FkbM family methyltransferase